MNNLSALTFETVPSLWKERMNDFKEASFDMKGNEKIDSAGIAYMVQWAKSRPEHKLVLRNVPKNAMNLITMFKLNDLFDFKE